MQNVESKMNLQMYNVDYSVDIFKMYNVVYTG